MRVYVEGKSQVVGRQHGKTDAIIMVILTAYCIVFFRAALGYLLYEYPNLLDNGNIRDPLLLQLWVVIGILGAITGGASGGS